MRYKSNIYIVLPKLDATKIISWNFYADDSPGNHKYGMILLRNFVYKLKIELCFSGDTVRGNGGACKGCTVPTKDVKDINFNM